MKFRIVNMTAFLDAPNGHQIDVLSPNQEVTGTGQVSGAFTQVKDSDGIQGWIATADASPIGVESRPDLNIGDFVSQCVAVEGAFNALPDTAPWFVSADFLIARAIIATGLKNAGPNVATSDAVGPLQVSSKEWASFLTSGSPLVSHFGADDFGNPMAQVYGAAYSMHRDAKDISAQKTPAGATDTFVPSYVDLLHAYLTNSAKAAVAILDAAKSDVDKTKPLNSCLSGVISADDLAQFFAAWPQFSGPAASPKTVDAFVQGTSSALNDALKSAFDQIRQFVPEELTAVKQGEAPWFDVAQAEKAAGIAEPNPRILTYFQSTDLRPLPTSTDTPWCGAFVAFCMDKSGNTTSIPEGSARAANWKTWGTPLPLKSDNVPNGAVVVLTPGEGSGGSGHVAFFAGYTADGNSVTLLGGNQSNQVKLSNFLVSRIATINWLDLQPTTKVGSDVQPSASPISDAAFNLIVTCEVSSEAVYNKKYQVPDWPGESSGVTIGIGYDVGQTAAATVKGDWQGVIPDTMLNPLLQTVGIVGPPAKARADALKGIVDISFDTAIGVHRTKVIPRWVGQVKATLPNTDMLNPDCLGALVSLTFNRGAGGYDSNNPRFAQMRAIKATMVAKNLAPIPQLIRDMKSLWPDSAGLRDRREQEAVLFETGLAKMPRVTG